MYSYSFTKHADRDLCKLPVDVQRRIIKKLKFYLATDQPLHFADAITGEEGKIYRFRIGDYRLIFECLDHEIIVLQVKPRPQAYR